MDELYGDLHQRRDPQRRWLLNTYQEGLGFRFLATRGGRPPRAPQPPQNPAVLRQRARLVRIAREDGIGTALALAECSRTSLWRWQCAYERGGLAGLVPERRGPRAPVLRHPVWLDCIELCGRPLDLMSDNGTPFVVWMPGVLTQFGTTLRDLEIRHIRTQVNSPWTNGKIEAFWATLKSEVLDREVFRSIEDAEAALERFARYDNYHRLHGEIGWLTPAERFDGTPFTDRGFDHIPALAHLQPWLAELRAAA